jgi:quinol-cytochrome oxidoreductase complex cytochrome b subunit
MGRFMLRFLRGGDHVTGGTLTRFYGIHVAVLPALTTALLLLHLLLVQRHGMSRPPGKSQGAEAEGEGRTMPFLPNFLLRDCIGWCVALGLLAALAALFPWELGTKADPFAPAPAGIRPEWYFGWMFQTLKVLPAHVLGIEGELLGIFAFAAGGLLFVLAPFLDRSQEARRVSLGFTVAGAIVIAYMAVMTVLVYLPGKP